MTTSLAAPTLPAAGDGTTTPRAAVSVSPAALSPQRPLVVDRRPLRGWSRIVLIVAIVATVASGAWLGDAAPVEARGPRPKAVVILGPVAGRVRDFRRSADHIARQARAAGMSVKRVYHPHATWERVVKVARGADLLVYVGHGNGWPSPYGPFQETTKNGFGLNPRPGSAPSEVDYRGGDEIRSQLRLAKGAVVVLYRSCYAAGNGESWQEPVRNRRLATTRVDNFAAGFLQAGASVVFAFYTSQTVDIPRQLMRSDRTMDGIFRLRGARVPAAYDGFRGWADYYRPSHRVRGMRLHLDPHPRYGHMRAVTGRLRMTAAEWRRHATRGSDRPRISRIHVLGGADIWRGAITFTPNGDGQADRLRVARQVSGKGRLRVEVRDRRGHVVRTLVTRVRPGTGITTWDGRDRAGRKVPDGRYRLTLTLRDASGRESRARHLDVQALRTFRSARISRESFHPSDRDALAAQVRVSAVLEEAAGVRWLVRDGSGRLVRTLLDRDRVRAGRIERAWDGRDERGRRVERGWYTITLAASTRAGTQRTEGRVWVGPYRVVTDREVARRGKRLRVLVRATEPQERAPRIEVRQPGVEPYALRTRRVDAGSYRVTFVPRRSGRAGTLRLVVEGVDREGGRDSQTRRLELR